MDDLKTCTRCSSEKPPSAFHNGKNYPDGKHPHCRACRKEYSDNTYDRAAQRDRNLRSCYGITAEEVDGMIWLQDNRCLICEDVLLSGQRGTHLDHDHATGSVRGVLCMDCNLGLGRFRDNEDRLRGAIRYLEMSWRR